MRDKLIELIASKVCDTYSEACDEWLPHDCGKCYANNCHIAEIADHLITNGMTIATDNSVAYKLKATEPLTNCQQWIPVTERLPEEGAAVLALCWWHESWQPHVCYLSPNFKGRWFTSIAGQWMMNVTHWMPLPELPKE